MLISLIILLQHSNGYRPTCATVNSYLPIPMHTKSNSSLFRNAGLFRHQFEMVYHLSLVTRHKHPLNLTLLLLTPNFPPPSTLLVPPATVTSVSIYSWWKPYFLKTLNSAKQSPNICKVGITPFFLIWPFFSHFLFTLLIQLGKLTILWSM